MRFSSALEEWPWKKRWQARQQIVVKRQGKREGGQAWKRAARVTRANSWWIVCKTTAAPPPRHRFHTRRLICALPFANCLLLFFFCFAPFNHWKNNIPKFKRLLSSFTFIEYFWKDVFPSNLSFFFFFLSSRNKGMKIRRNNYSIIANLWNFIFRATNVRRIMIAFERVEEGEKGRERLEAFLSRLTSLWDTETGRDSFWWHGSRTYTTRFIRGVARTRCGKKEREREREKKRKEEGRKEGEGEGGGYDRHWLVVVGERSCTLFLAFHPGFVPLGFYTTAIHHTIASFAFYCRTIRPTYVKCTVFCATYCLFRSNLYPFFLSR